jgi:CelD/BcsL family acetyltransferase involved in cellulose biosynthesis
VIHFFEGLSEQGTEWLITHAQLLQAHLPRAAGPSLSFETVSDFDFASAEYARLFERADASAFQHPIWLDRAFARLVDRTKQTPAILIGRSGREGRLALAVPMIRRKLGPFSVLDAADFDVGDYNALVVDRQLARDDETAQQIARCLGKFSIVRVRKVRDQSLGLCLADPPQVSPMDFMAHEVELGVPLDGWQSRLLKCNVARYLKSKRKRLAAKGTITFEALSRPDRIRAAFEEMRAFRQERWAEDLLADPRYLDFYVDVAIAGEDTGFSRTYVLSVNGRTAAVLFGVCHRGRFCFLLLGFENQMFRNHSAGLLALENAIEDCIRRGDDVFDLTIGDEAYKRDFATRSVPMSVFWFGRKPLTRLAPAALSLARRVRARLGKPRMDRAASSTGGTPG